MIYPCSQLPSVLFVIFVLWRGDVTSSLSIKQAVMPRISSTSEEGIEEGDGWLPKRKKWKEGRIWMIHESFEGVFVEWESVWRGGLIPSFICYICACYLTWILTMSECLPSRGARDPSPLCSPSPHHPLTYLYLLFTYSFYYLTSAYLALIAQNT